MHAIPYHTRHHHPDFTGRQSYLNISTPRSYSAKCLAAGNWQERRLADEDETDQRRRSILPPVLSTTGRRTSTSAADRFRKKPTWVRTQNEEQNGIGTFDRNTPMFDRALCNAPSPRASASLPSPCQPAHKNQRTNLRKQLACSSDPSAMRLNDPEPLPAVNAAPRAGSAGTSHHWSSTGNNGPWQTTTRASYGAVGSATVPLLGLGDIQS